MCENNAERVAGPCCAVGGWHPVHPHEPLKTGGGTPALHVELAVMLIW